MRTGITKFLSVSFCLFFLGISHLFAQSPLERHGKLHAADGKVLDKSGKEPQLRGISLSWSIWQGRKYYTPEVIDWLISDFRISVIRIAMAVEPENGYLQDPSGQLKTIEPVIDRALSRGIYVIIDWHDHHADKNEEKALQFFSKMAQKYASSPNVVYEIWNEPDRQNWPIIKAYSENIITEIRKHDKDKLIVVGSPRWDQDVNISANDPIAVYSNIAYSFHFYATEPSHQDGLRAKAEDALQKKHPLFVTEWGVGEANGDGEFNREKTKTWLDWMENRKLSWVNWNITDKDETTAILKPGASVKGGWQENDLTEAGNYIREVLRKLNP